VEALARHVEVSPSAALTTLWKLHEFDFDDRRFAHAWLALESHVGSSPNAVQGLVRLSKRPLAQTLLASTLVAMRSAASASPQADAFVRASTSRLNRSTMGGSDGRRRRSTAACSILQASHARPRIQESDITSAEATAYELSAALMSFQPRSMMEPITNRLNDLVATAPHALDVVIILGSAAPAPARVAGNVALRQQLVQHDSVILGPEDRARLRQELISANWKWARDAQNVRTLLRLFSSDRRAGPSDEVSQFYAELMHSGNVPHLILFDFADGVPIALSKSALRSLDNMSDGSHPDQVSAAREILLRRLSRSGPRHQTTRSAQGDRRTRHTNSTEQSLAVSLDTTPERSPAPTFAAGDRPSSNDEPAHPGKDTGNPPKVRLSLVVLAVLMALIAATVVFALSR
jgi:hypothetical protein